MVALVRAHAHTRSELSSVSAFGDEVNVIENSEPDWLLPLHHCYNNNELSRVSQPRCDVGPRWPSRERGLFLIGELMAGWSVWTTSGGSLLSSWKLLQSGSSSCNSKQRVAAGANTLNVAIWQRARAGSTQSSLSHDSTRPRLVPVRPTCESPECCLELNTNIDEKQKLVLKRLSRRGSADEQRFGSSTPGAAVDEMRRSRFD